MSNVIPFSAVTEPFGGGGITVRKFLRLHGDRLGIPTGRFRYWLNSRDQNGLTAYRAVAKLDPHRSGLLLIHLPAFERWLRDRWQSKRRRTRGGAGRSTSAAGT